MSGRSFFQGVNANRIASKILLKYQVVVWQIKTCLMAMGCKNCSIFCIGFSGPCRFRATTVKIN